MRKFLRRCLKSDRGLAAVEFAFVLPIILSMFLALVELSQALGVRADVINMASTGGDLIAQKATATGADLDGAFNALNAMLFPHVTDQAVVTITSVVDGGAGNAPVIAWSCSMGGENPATPMTRGSAPSPAIPAGLIVAGKGGSVIWSRVTYRYNSFLSYFLATWTNWTNDFYLKPRRVLQIPYSANPASTMGTCNF